MTKGGSYAIGISTTLESTKSLPLNPMPGAMRTVFASVSGPGAVYQCHA